MISLLRRLRRSYRRSAPCEKCQQETLQLLHGYDAEGKLWKGHECLCRGWECTQCRTVLDKKADCCR